MKKHLSSLLIISCFLTCPILAQVPQPNLSATVTTTKVVIKDPKLIALPNIKLVDDKKYNQKLENDKKQYQSYKNELKDEQEQLYLMLDRILRANKLQYQNWRIGIKVDTEEVNAQAGSANLILINSSLYDSLYDNKDALAFVVAHELSHLILGHSQKSYENNYKIKRLQENIEYYKEQSRIQNNNATLNSALGNSYAATGDTLMGISYSTSMAVAHSQINKLYAQERQLEYEADTEAITLMTRAGFDPQKALDAMNFLSALPNVQTASSSHPSDSDRIDNIENEIQLVDIEELGKQGKSNIYDSEVLVARKSSDKKTVILSSQKNSYKNTYIPQTKEDKLMKKAYKYYLDNDYILAKTYFIQAYAINKTKNYLAPLYLSYILEYDYKNNNQDKKSLKQAMFWIKKAKRLKPEDKFVIKQTNDLKELILSAKLAKKADLSE